MGLAMELLTGFVTAPGTTLTGLTMAVGNQLAVRSADINSDIRLLTAWTDNQTQGLLRIRSPRLHDFVQGILLVAPAAEPEPLYPPKYCQKLYSQDTLTVELSGSATAGDIETACLVTYYENLLGVDSRLADPEFVMQHMVYTMGVANTLSLGTGGGYSGEETIIAEQDTFKANIDYALLGYVVSSECAAIRWRGVDTGNLGVGGPGNANDQKLTSSWFIYLSEVTGRPCIPIFNSANRGAILVDGATDENGTDVTVTSIFAELR